MTACGPKAPKVDWRVQREQLRREGARVAMAEAGKLVPVEEVAAELGVKWPAFAPTKDKGQVKAEADEAIAVKVLAKFPEETPQKLRAELETQHVGLPVGSETSFLIRGGVGRSAKVAGKFFETSDTQVRIGDRWVLKTDMRDEDRAKFDAAFRDRVIEKLYLQKLFLFKDDRERYQKQIAKQVYIDAFTVADYTLHERRWVSGKELVEGVRQERLEELAETLKPDMQQKVFSEAGYVFREGEWQPSKIRSTVKFLHFGRKDD